MRVKSAIAVFVLGLVALLLGIGQRTVWAPPTKVSVALPASAQDAPLTVVDPSFARFGGGPVDIHVKGEGKFTVAEGRPGDVDAWVGKTAHNTVKGLSSDRSALDVQHSDGDAGSPNPADADLWAGTQAGNGDLSFTWAAPAAGDWSLLIASDGTKPAPKQLEFTFPNQATNPWSIPLMVLGGLLMVGALLFAFLFGKPKGPGKGAPVTGTEGPAPESAGASGGEQPSAFRRIPVLAGAVALVVGGVAGAAPAQADSSPSASTTSSDRGAAAVVTDQQLQRIVSHTADAVNNADAAKNAKDLGARAANDVLNIRTQNYKIRAKVSSAAAVAPVSADKILAHVAPSSASWPRTLIAVTQGGQNPTPLILTLQQNSARENYKLASASYLLPGTAFPSMGLGGVPTVAPGDSKDLLSSPADAFKALAARLKDSKSPEGAKFADSPFFQETESFKKDALSEQDNKAGLVPQFDFQLIGDPKVTFRASDGGAVAVADLKFTIVIPQKNDGDIVTLDPKIAALTGEDKSEKKLTQTFVDSVSIRIPAAGSTDKFALLSADRNLTDASLG